MSIQIITDDGAHLLPTHEQRSAARKGIIDAMARDLVVGNANGLDLTCERDVKLHLAHEDRYSDKAIRLYTLAAIIDAQDIVVTASMGGLQRVGRLL